MWIGIVIVAVSVLAGARLLSAADDTVSLWAAASDMGAGDEVTADDLVATRVRFADAGDLDGYFTVDDELPADLALTRGVGTGELLPRAAVGSADGGDLLQVPIAVDAELVPSSVESGSVVDIYLVAASASRSPGRAQAGDDSAPALAGVTVVDAPPLDEGFAATGKRQLVLAVDEQATSRFFRLLGAYDSPVLTVVRRG
jgi:hypothetical protein